MAQTPPAIEVKIDVTSEAYNNIITAIKGTGDNQVYMLELIMNNTITLSRIVKALRTNPSFNYSSEAMEYLSGIDTDVLDAQIVSLNDVLENMDLIRNGEQDRNDL